MRPTIPLRGLGRSSLASRAAEPISSATHRVASTGTLVRRRRSLRRGWRLPRVGVRPTRRSAVALIPIAVVLLAGAYYAKHEVGKVTGGVAAEFRAGQAALESGKTELKKASAAHDLRGIEQSKAQFAAAGIDFAAGAGVIDGSKVVRVARLVPLLGGLVVTPRVQAVDHLGAMGVALSQAASGAADVDLKLTAPDPHGLKGSPHLLAALKQSESELKVVQSDLLTAQSEAHQVDPGLLPGSEQATFHKSLGSIDKAAGGIVEFNRLIPAIFEILGGNGPRTYLIEQVNPSELRSGGGFIGSLSVARADQGKLTILKSGDVYQLEGPRGKVGDPGYVAPPREIGIVSPAYFGIHASWALADSNVFPDQASNMRWGEWFAQRGMNLKPDGIIVMDYYAIADLLKVTGPIKLPDYGVTFTGDNFVSQVVAQDNAQTSTHKSILAAAAQPLLRNISELPTARWPQLISALNTAVTQGHMQVYFNSPVAETQMTHLGWFRSINPNHSSDFMMETEDNFAGSKVNHFVARHYTVDLTRTPSGIHHRVTVDLTIDEPFAGIRTTRNYYAYLRFYVPRAATGLRLASSSPADASIVRVDPSATSVPAGLRAIGGHFNIAMSGVTHGSYQVTIQYDTPWSGGAGDTQSLYWQKQPGPVADGVSVIWKVGGHTYRAAGSLTQDLQLQLAQGGVTLRPARSADVQLPSINLG